MPEHGGWMAWLVGLPLLVCGFGCSRVDAGRSDKEETCELRYLGSLGNVTIAELAEDLGYLAPCKLTWQGNVLGGPESIQAVSTGDVDFGSAATGSVLKLIASGAPITQVIASNGVDERTWGGYFVLQDSPLHNAHDLIGKKIAVNTLGAHAEFMIREYLVRGGLTRQEIQQVTMVVTPPLNGEQTLRLGQVDVAALSAISRDRALAHGGLRALFRDRDLFGDFNSSTMVVRKDALQKRRFALGKLIEGSARAIEWARSTPHADSSKRIGEIFAKRKRGEDPALVQYWHSYGVRTRGGLLSDSDMQPWIDWLTREGDLPASKRGKLPVLYTNELNPFREDGKRAALE